MSPLSLKLYYGVSIYHPTSILTTRRAELTAISGFPLSFGVFQNYYSQQPQFANNPFISIVGTVASGISYLGAPLVIPVIKRYSKYQRHMIWIGCQFPYSPSYFSSLCSPIDSYSYRASLYPRTRSRFLRQIPAYPHLHARCHVRSRLLNFLLSHHILH